MLRKLLSRRLFTAGAVLLGMVFMLIFSAPWISPYDPDAQNEPASGHLQPPSKTHLFGTDQFGRDILSRTLHGGRISLFLAFAVMIVAVALGTLYGAVAGYLGRSWDVLLMRVADVLLAFPLLFLIVTCIALFGRDLRWLIVVLSLTGWMDVARLVRAEVRSLKDRPFVIRARAQGLPLHRILLRHLVPNVAATVVAVAVLRMADIVLIESALSFLGIGVQPPTATWGTILKDGRIFLATAPWIAFFPGVTIILTILGLAIVAEGLKSPAALQPDT